LHPGGGDLPRPEWSGGGKRAAGSALRFADPKVQALWHGLVLFRVQANDFRHADLRRYWAALTGRAESEIGQGAITYQLRRLRLHGLIERLPKTHRYRVTAKGLRAALFCTRSYTRILRPGLAFGLPGHRTIETPLKRALDNFEKEVQAWVHDSKLAA
jgi:DNA-binding HxlR family transcriptional regulator